MQFRIKIIITLINVLFINKYQKMKIIQDGIHRDNRGKRKKRALMMIFLN